MISNFTFMSEMLSEERTGLVKVKIQTKRGPAYRWKKLGGDVKLPEVKQSKDIEIEPLSPEKAVENEKKLGKIDKELKKVDKELENHWEKKETMPREKWDAGFIPFQKKREEIMMGLRNLKLKPKVPITFDYGNYPIVADAKRGEYSKGKFMMLSPDEYFKLSPDRSKGRYILHPQNIIKILDAVNKTGKINVGFIEIKDGKAIDHEGRHNAFVARMFGLKKVPVLIDSTETKDKEDLRFVEPQY